MTAKKRSFVIVAGFLFFLAVYLMAAVCPYLNHKEVSQEYKNQINMIDFYEEHQGSERVAYVDDNTEALILRLQMIEMAQEEIILSTFDFNGDESGKDMMSALMHAAHRGVKVKVIVDGLSGFLDLRGNEWFQALALEEGVEIRIYNPVNLLKPWQLQARLHDKYLIVDDTAYLLGGRNTTDLFLGDYSSSKNIDRELLVYEQEPSEASSLMQAREYFQQIWELECSRDYVCEKETKKIADARTALEKRHEKLPELYPEMLVPQDWEARTMETDKVTLLSNPIEPENKAPNMWYALNQLMKTGEQVTVYTPYIICGEEMYQDLEQLCQETEQVEIITNDVTSGANPWGCTDYMNQKENIWATGVTVYEYLGAHSSHTKAVLVDDTISVVGSYNMDMRSTYQDTELMLVVDSPELNQVIRKEAEHDKTYSRVMTSGGMYKYGENYEPREMSWKKKIYYGIFRVITVPIRKFL